MVSMISVMHCAIDIIGATCSMFFGVYRGYTTYAVRHVSQYHLIVRYGNDACVMFSGCVHTHRHT